MNQHDPFALMMDEHQLIVQARQVISRIDDLWSADAAAYRAVVTRLLTFFKVFSDQYHHQKEERLLFPALCAHPDFMLRDIVVELEEHHQQFRDYAGQIDQALAADDFPQVQSLLTIYIDELLDHIAIEDDELFILCRDLLTANEQERLYFQFMDVDNELGQAGKQALMEQLQELVEKYAD
jgi:hemerythrin-like domain-containing protein